jgi:hypothetical protein
VVAGLAAPAGSARDGAIAAAGAASNATVRRRMDRVRMVLSSRYTKRSPQRRRITVLAGRPRAVRA